MYYILLCLLAVVGCYVLIRVLRSVVKGCFVVIFLAIAITIVILFTSSKNNPVTISDYYVIDNFKVRRL